MTRCWGDQPLVMATELFFRQVGDNARTLLSKFLSLEAEDNFERLSMAGAWMNLVERPPYNTQCFNHWRYTRTPVLRDGIETEGHQNLDDMLATGEIFLTIINNGITQNWPQNLGMKALLGIIADAYAPLHNAELFSSEFPDGDASGDNFFVKWNDNYVRLSWFWDTGCGRYVHQLPFSEQEWGEVDATVDAMKKQFLYRSMSIQKDLQKIHNDSYNVSVEKVYKGLVNGSELTPEYVEMCKDITDERIARAGYTMTKLMNYFTNPVFPEVKKPIHPKMSTSFIMSVGFFAFLAPVCIYVVWRFFKVKEKMD